MIQSFQRESRGLTFAARRRTTSKQWRALAFITRGEIAFLVFTAVCVALHPGFVLKRDEGGMSNYGVHIKTALPYTLAVALLAIYNLRAASIYSDDDRRSRRMRFMLVSYSVVLGLVLLSTYGYTRNATLKDIHFALGTLLIVVVCAGSLWMYRSWPQSAAMRVCLIFQLTGDVLNLVTVVGALHVLFLAEMMSNIGFALILIRSARRVAVEDGQGPVLRDALQ